MKEAPIIEVLWEDCLLFTGGWEAHSEVMRTRKRIRQRSVGYVLENSKARVVLAGSLSQGGNVFGAHVIPRSQIIKIKVIR